MSNKLKAKPRKQRFPLAQSNQAAQAFGRAMVNCHSQIKSMEKEAYENGSAMEKIGLIRLTLLQP